MEDRWKNHADMENVMIKVKNLHKKFEDLDVLSGIDEHITQGEVVVVIGPSGSGKSTFLRCLNLLETVTEGEIYVDDELITAPKVNVNRVRQKMGMVFQQFNLFPHLTIMDNITLAPVLLKSREWRLPGRLLWILRSCCLTNPRLPLTRRWWARCWM